jgi:hypothetical protein
MRKPAVSGSRRPPGANKDLMALVGAIVSGNIASVLDILKASPDLVQKSAVAGASREAAYKYFYPEIGHYL